MAPLPALKSMVETFACLLVVGFFWDRLYGSTSIKALAATSKSCLMLFVLALTKPIVA